MRSQPREEVSGRPSVQLRLGLRFCPIGGSGQARPTERESMLPSWVPCGCCEEPRSQRFWSTKPRLHRIRSPLVCGWAFQDQSMRHGVSENTSVHVQAGRRLVHGYASLPGTRITKEIEATGSCWIHFEASNRVRQRRLGTLTGQGQKTHRRRPGYQDAHRALLAKNGSTAPRTQRRPLVLCASTRQVGIRKVRGRSFGGEGVVGTLGSRARLGHGHPGGELAHQFTPCPVGSSRASERNLEHTGRKRAVWCRRW